MRLVVTFAIATQDTACGCMGVVFGEVIVRYWGYGGIGDVGWGHKPNKE